MSSSEIPMSRSTNLCRALPLVILLAGGGLPLFTPVVGRAADGEDERRAALRWEFWHLQLRPSESDSPDSDAFSQGQVMTREELNESLQRLRQANRIADSTVLQMGGIAGDPVTIRLGKTTPRITGVAQRPGAPAMVQTQNQSVGLQLALQSSRQDDQRLRVQLQFDRSSPADSDVVLHEPDEGEPIYQAEIDTLQLESTLDIPWDGIVCALHSRSDTRNARYDHIILIRAERAR